MGSAEVADAAAYPTCVAGRAAALPAVRDRAVTLSGREPAWEQASRLLQHGYGRMGLGCGCRCSTEQYGGCSVCSRRRSWTVRAGWIRLDTGSRWAGCYSRRGLTISTFGNWDHACYDPIYDLAGVDPGSPDGAFVVAPRIAVPTDPERFLPYELVHLQEPTTSWSRDRRASSRAVARYLAAISRRPGTGGRSAVRAGCRRCAGVHCLRFSMVTPAALLAVRALASHGFRPVPVTGRPGRSVGEVRERCAILGFVGGVAEYGAVVYE